jgi:hypothetical protein
LQVSPLLEEMQATEGIGTVETCLHSNKATFDRIGSASPPTPRPLLLDSFQITADCPSFFSPLGEGSLVLI